MTYALKRQMPLYLLAPKVAAAARTVAAGGELNDADKAVLAEARAQLVAEEASMTGRQPLHHAHSAALASSTDTSLALAELVLESRLAADEGPVTVSEAVEAAAQELDQCVMSLAAVEGGDRTAAEALAQLFEGIVDEVFSRNRALDFA